MWLSWVFILFPLPLPSGSVTSVPQLPSFRGGLGAALWLDVVFLHILPQDLPACAVPVLALLPIIFLASVWTRILRLAFQFKHHSLC